MSGRQRPNASVFVGWSRSRVWLVVCAVLALSCRSRAAQTIKDSDGRQFSSQCSADRICVLTPQASAPAGPRGEPEPAQLPTASGAGRGEFKLRATGRLVGVCGPSGAGADSELADCRPVVCASAADCPASEGLDSGSCVGGLCTEPSHAINSDDSVMLCLAGTGLGRRTAEQIERLALGLNCGTPCRIPRPCRQL